MLQNIFTYWFLLSSYANFTFLFVMLEKFLRRNERKQIVHMVIHLETRTNLTHHDGSFCRVLKLFWRKLFLAMESSRAMGMLIHDVTLTLWEDFREIWFVFRCQKWVASLLMGLACKKKVCMKWFWLPAEVWFVMLRMMAWGKNWVLKHFAPYHVGFIQFMRLYGLMLLSLGCVFEAGGRTHRI